MLFAGSGTRTEYGPLQVLHVRQVYRTSCIICHIFLLQTGWTGTWNPCQTTSCSSWNSHAHVQMQILKTTCSTCAAFISCHYPRTLSLQCSCITVCCHSCDSVRFRSAALVRVLSVCSLTLLGLYRDRPTHPWQFALRFPVKCCS